MTGWIVVLVIVGYIVIAFFVEAFLAFITREWCYFRAKNFTEPFVERLGHVVLVCGRVGSGKSTCSAGLANVATKLNMANAQKRIDDIRLMLSDIDFDALDSVIITAFKQKRYNTDFVIAKSGLKKKFEKEVYDDGVHFYYYIELLRDYIDAFMAVLRNNYVYFLNSEFFNRVTKNYAMKLDHDSTAIRNRYASKNYNLFRYATIFEDEVLLKSGNNQNWQKVAAEDPGNDVFLELIRHIGKGTIRYIAVAQDFNRFIKNRREFATNILDMYNIKIIKNSPIQKWLYNSLFSIFSYIDRFLKDSFSKKFYSKHFSKQNLIRTIMAKLKYKLSKLEGKDYVKYQGVMYFSHEDFRKENPRCGKIPFSIYFPLLYSFGSLNTYEYSAVHDVLSNDARENKEEVDINPQPSLASRDKYARSVLEKRVKSDYEWASGSSAPTLFDG